MSFKEGGVVEIFLIGGCLGRALQAEELCAHAWSHIMCPGNDNSPLRLGTCFVDD